MTTPSPLAVRCFGNDDPLYATYHDEEWGVPVHGDGALYERLVLEAMQSGLAWITVLRKRESFRAAFDGFDPHTVAEYGPDDVERLMADAGIIRNRRKIEAAITNARAVVALQADGGSLDQIVWAHAPEPRKTPPATWEDVPAQTAESVALAKALKKVGFVFVGPTTMYAAMQACGLVDDHIAGCIARVGA